MSGPVPLYAELLRWSAEPEAASLSADRVILVHGPDSEPLFETYTPSR